MLPNGIDPGRDPVCRFWVSRFFLARKMCQERVTGIDATRRAKYSVQYSTVQYSTSHTVQYSTSTAYCLTVSLTV